MTGLVLQSKSLSKTVFMSLRHAANLQHSQQSTLNTTVTLVVFAAQCCCKILSNEHTNCLSTCFDEEVKKTVRYFENECSVSADDTERAMYDWSSAAD